MKYIGIELEFFVVKKDTTDVVPAYKVTKSLDGNPFIGELKTKPHKDIYNLIYELKSLIHKEKDLLNNKGYDLLLVSEVDITRDQYKDLRRDKAYVNNKDLEILDAISIYDKGTGKVLQPTKFKASLQLNISDNSSELAYYKDGSSHQIHISDVFNFVDIIRKLDNAYVTTIKTANRVKGVYCIKNGIMGKRIEYRSLPNTVNLDILLKQLQTII